MYPEAQNTHNLHIEEICVANKYFPTSVLLLDSYNWIFKTGLR